jgi:hypothetical protein
MHDDPKPSNPVLRDSRLRALRSLIERNAEIREPLAGGANEDNDGARDLLRREIVIFSGS